MRRTPVAAAALLLVAASASAAYADGTATDVVAAPAAAGALTIAGVGATAAAPLTASATIGTQGSSFGGTSLTVTDARGVESGWQVTAKYLDRTDLASITSAQLAAAGATAVANLGGANIAVTATPTAGNSATGVPDGAASWGAGRVLSGPVSLVSTTGDGRGVTVFTTNYKITLPAKTSSAATLYTGTIEYTVGPKAS
jgi:hypothetical protein